MITIELNKKSYSIPEKWDELTEKQLLQVMDILFIPGEVEGRPEYVLLKLIQALTGASARVFSSWDVTEIEEYFYLTTFLLKPDIQFTKNILPAYKLSHTNFYGPADFLDNLRMKEFTLTEDLYVRWYDSEKKDIESLNELIAILYRPAPSKYDFEKNPNGDFREAFNQNTSSFYARSYVSDWPVNVKLAIATWYGGCRTRIVANNPDVFEGGEGDPARYGLVSVMLSVAETHVFGDFENVEEQYVNLIMMQLNETIDKGKRLERASTI